MEYRKASCDISRVPERPREISRVRFICNYINGMSDISLLLCHGNEDYGIVGLDPNTTITVNNDPIVQPDILIDIFRFKCVGCHIFDRIYLMFCPLGFDFGNQSAKGDVPPSPDPLPTDINFINVIENIVKGALAPNGILFTPKYGGGKGRNRFDELMKSLGFYRIPYTNTFPAPQSTKNTNILGKPMNFKLIEYVKFYMNKELNLNAYGLIEK
jgi:hypothetical protein